MSVTISDIENAIVERLKAKWAEHGGSTAVYEFDIGNDFENILKTPAISVSTEKIGLRRILDLEFEIKPLTTIYMVFKNVFGVKERRNGVYPMVMGTIGILVGQTLGLEIDPLMPVGSADEIFHAKLKELKAVAFKVSFSTSFNLENLTDGEDVTRLIAMGNYYYQNDREEAVASDIINFEE